MVIARRPVPGLLHPEWMEQSAILNAMRVLLLDADNGLYWAASGKWTKSLELAHDFQTRAAAAEAWLKSGITNGRVYYAFPQESSNFSAPLYYAQKNRPRWNARNSAI